MPEDCNTCDTGVKMLPFDRPNDQWDDDEWRTVLALDNLSCTYLQQLLVDIDELNALEPEEHDEIKQIIQDKIARNECVPDGG
jgi:hypothetical protein